MTYKLTTQSLGRLHVPILSRILCYSGVLCICTHNYSPIIDLCVISTSEVVIVYCIKRVHEEVRAGCFKLIQ